MQTITISKDDFTTVIPQLDIKNEATTTEEIDINGSKLVASDYELNLNNTDRAIYDPRYDGLFAGYWWYNASITVYDTLLKKYIFQGRIKQVTVKDSDNVITIYSVNMIREVADAICVASDITGTLTPAAAIYSILTDVSGLNIPTDNINGFEFQQAISYQQQSNDFVMISITRDKNIKCLDAVKELCKLGLCKFYLIDNYIGLYQYTPYAGETGIILDDSVVLPSSYSQTTSDADIYNSYTIKYWDGTAFQTIEGWDTPSKLTYGERSLIIPDKTVKFSDTPVVTDISIVLYGLQAALFVGNQSIDQYKYMQQICTFNVNDSVADKVHINSINALCIDTWINEPIRITKHQQKENGVIALTALFLNQPQRVVRDTTRPSKPVINAAVSVGTTKIQISFSAITGCIGYKIYARSRFETLTFDKKFSTLNNTNSLVITVPQAEQYDIWVEAYNSMLIKSLPSDKKSVIMNTVNLPELFYSCNGNAFGDGVYIDVKRCEGLPSGLFPESAFYGSKTYGSGYYQPGTIWCSYSMRLSSRQVVLGLKGDFTIYIRNYNGISWSSWNKIGRFQTSLKSITADSTIFQIATVFHNVTYYDDMKFSILEAS